MWRPVRFICLALCLFWLGCGPATPADDGGLDSGLDAAADGAADGDVEDDGGPRDGDVDDGDVEDDGGTGDPCDACPESCVLGRCAAETCEQGEYVAVSATLEHEGTLVDLDLDAGWLYALDRSEGFLVLDATDPERLEQVASLPMAGGYGMDVAGDRAYVVVEGELRVVDLSDPTVPMAGTTVSAWGSEVRVWGDLLIITGADRVQLFDQSDRDAPSLVGEVPLPETEHGADRARGSARIGSTLLVGAESGGLAVVDIASPSEASVVEVLPLDVQVNDVFLDGGELLVATSTGLSSFDVSDPRAPVATARFVELEVGRATSIVPWGEALLALAGQATLVEGSPPTGTLLRTPGYVNDAATSVDWAFLATSDSGLHSVPLDARLEGPRRLLVGGGEAVALALEGARLYVGLGDDGVEAWDLGALPEVRVASAGETPAHRLTVSGGLLAISSGTELALADGETLEVHSTVPVPQVGHSLATTISSMWIEGPLVFVAARALTDGLLMTVDASDPSSPAVIFTRALDGSEEPAALAASGDRLFVGHEGGGGGWIAVYDVADPTSPVELGRVEDEGLRPINAIVPHGDHLFVAASSLVVVDVSDPSSPRPAGGWEGRALALSVSGSLLYAADRALPSPGLNILDVTDPAAPTLETNHPVEIPFLSRADVVAAARFAFISNGTSEVTVIPVCR